MHRIWGVIIQVISVAGVAVSNANCPSLVTFPNTATGIMTCSGTECANCNVNCDPTQDCYIKCTSIGSCSGLVVNCGTSGKCVVECDTSACSNMQIKAPDTGNLRTVCRGASACNGLDIRKQTSTGDYDIVCEDGACLNSQIRCPDSPGRCDIKCKGLSTCQGGTVQSVDGGPLNIRCVESIAGDTKSCMGLDVNCPPSSSCKLSCEQSNSCYGLNLVCPSTAMCDINCAGEKACFNADVNRNVGKTSGASVNIRCAGSQSCYQADFDCTKVDTCNRRCIGIESCYQSTTDCKNVVKSCKVHCEGARSCFGSGSNMPSCPTTPTDGCQLRCKEIDACIGVSPSAGLDPIICTTANACSVDLLAAGAQVRGLTDSPTAVPTAAPTAVPIPQTAVPVAVPTAQPTSIPTTLPTATPTTTPTNIPLGTTIAPDTLVPNTQTQTPVSSIPVTGIPTQIPVEETAPPNPYVLPEEDRDQIKQVTNIATVGAFASMSAGGAGSAARIHLITSFTCAVSDVDLKDDAQLDIAFHPTRVAFSFGGPSRQYIVAALIMNPVLLLGFAVLLVIVASFVHFISSTPWGESFGNLRAPGILYIPYLFLLQGTSLAAARAVFHPRGPVIVIVLGSVSLLISLASPLILYLKVLRRVAPECTQIADPRLYKTVDSDVAVLVGLKASVYRFVFGKYIWVSRDTNSTFVERYGMIFDSFLQGKTWFAICEAIVIVTLSLFSAWQPAGNTYCGIRNLLICLLFLIFLLLLVIIRPYSSPLDNILSGIVAAMVFIAVLFMTIGLWMGHSPDGVLFTMASWLLLLTAILVIFKCIWDAVLYLIDVCWLARRGIAKMISRGKGENQGDCSFDNYVSPTELDSCVDTQDPLLQNDNLSRMESLSSDLIPNRDLRTIDSSRSSNSGAYLNNRILITCKTDYCDRLLV